MASSPPVLFLHIGAMKTGTSYLQRLLGDNKATLSDQGVLFPGPDGWSNQVLAVRDVLNLRMDAEIRERAQGAWERLKDEMSAWQGRASVVSMEFLSFANARKARRVLTSLKGADVHVILTVRDSSRVIPAQWQEGCQNRGTTSWESYTRSVLAGPDEENEDWRTFRRALAIPRMLDSWGPLLPKDRLHVVLVPASREDPTLLWRRFSSVIGVDPDSCTPPTGQRNASLGYASADLVRRVNVHLGEIGQFAYSKTMKAYLSKQVLAARSGEPKVSTSHDLAEFALNWNRSMSDAIAKSGAQVIGEPSDLDVAQIQTEGIEPPSEDALLAAAVDAVTGLQKLIGTRTQRLAAAREARADSAGEPSLDTVPVVDPDSWAAQEDSIDSAAQDVARLAVHAINLRSALRAADGKPVGDSSFEESLPPAGRAESTGVVGRVLRRARQR